ncbi:MAG TPA: thiosulfate oxidation carrier protein SoxY [Burkholderiales bacterium]|nr:thiosulfate oxidation carrier protein SoxY [Burkholderiales bacterium]
MHKLRRAFLLKNGVLLTAFAAGLLLRPLRLLAAEWNQFGFRAKALADALKSIGAINATLSNDILIKAPDLAENGARVQIEILSKIPGTQMIAILAEKNPFPLIASFEFADGAEAFVSTYIKMGESANVRVVVNAGGKMYTAAKEVKVTIGGCGG